jgi:catechol 2,3-dioxygenase-like lactoylglutathione lyase family enzyme
MPENGVKVWYRVRDLAAARLFYVDLLGFEETYHDAEGRWARLRNGSMEIGLTEGAPEEGGVAVIDAADVKAGTVLELHGKIRLLDVFDLDGNRIQLVESLTGG